jgi:predicted DNA-binding transcriptional regulator AlpA
VLYWSYVMSKIELDEITLLDLRQLAEVLDRSPDTVKWWLKTGMFPSPLQLRDGGKQQWTVATIKAWIEKRKRARHKARSPRGALMRGTRLVRQGRSKR